MDENNCPDCGEKDGDCHCGDVSEEKEDGENVGEAPKEEEEKEEEMDTMDEM